MATAPTRTAATGAAAAAAALFWAEARMPRKFTIRWPRSQTSFPALLRHRVAAPYFLHRLQAFHIRRVSLGPLLNHPK
eukprot:2846673-Pleurochrysis_carterae.AAC.1